jgi:simple sugar transport system ATP-binding protein
MKILFGEESATRGNIYVREKKVSIMSPAAAIKLGIGMVHQHFMLVDSLTVLENIILGIEPKKRFMIDKKQAESMVLTISNKYNLQIDPRIRVRDLTVGQKQKVEILKALLRGAKILILDEPTAVLTPQETRELFLELKNLRDAGYTVIFISHKLGEVRELCERITIIRRGETMGVYNLSDVTEEDISRLMVGRDVILNIEKLSAKPGKIVLQVKDLVILNEEGRPAVNHISFTARKGEILGVAGVEGNGQHQLVQALTGLCRYHGGEITILGKNIDRFSVRQLRKLKVCHIPEDRMTIGLAPVTITENMLADKIDNLQFSGRTGFLKHGAIRAYGKNMVHKYGVLAKSPDVPITSLSGGNIQKVVLARELSSEPEVIIADQPTRGVDVGATEFIRKTLLEMRDEGCTVFLVTSDLNEVLGLSDRLLVLFEGEVVAYFSDSKDVTEEVLGRYMLGVDRQAKKDVRRALDE